MGRYGHFDYLIAYAYYPGNARELLEHAQAREKKELIHIENLADGVSETAPGYGLAAIPSFPLHTAPVLI